MRNWKLFNLIKISVENPLKEWILCRKYFIMPKLKIGFAQRNWHEGPLYKLLEVYSRSLFYKDKYGMLEYENDPYVEVTLLGFITIHLSISAPDALPEMEDICYWEGMLSYIQKREKKVVEHDALYLAYKDNIWTRQDGPEFTIKPFLTNLGWHTLQSAIQKHAKDFSDDSE